MQFITIGKTGQTCTDKSSADVLIISNVEETHRFSFANLSTSFFQYHKAVFIIPGVFLDNLFCTLFGL